jgi:hypothetical protein
VTPPESVIRAFELPVQSVECLDGKDGWALLCDCWREATRLANWGVLQLLRSDVTRTPDLGRLPKRPCLNGARLKGLYGLASETFGFKAGWWAGACISASTILRDVERKYAAERLDVIWRQRLKPTWYAHPYPWPVHAQGWKGCGFEDSGRPWVLATLPGGLARLRLRGGPEFGRQLALFRQVVRGELPRRALVIRQQGSSNSCHRPTVKAGGRPCRVMLKMVADVPVTPRPGGRALVLLTDPASFWVAELDGRRAWVLNADHVRRAVARHAEHLRRLQRMAEDAKAERRLTGHRDCRQLPRLGRLAHKDRNRLASFTHEAAAHLVGFAARQGVGEVFYLDRDRGFMPRFPWHELHRKLAEKCAAGGVVFYSESSLKLSGADPLNFDSDPEADIDAAEEDDKWTRIARLREMVVRRLTAARGRAGSHPAVSAP